MANPKIDKNYLTAVRQMLIDRFDLDELRDLCFALGIDYAVFPQWRAGMARELVVQLVRNNQMSRLMSTIQRERPDIDILKYLTSYKTVFETKPTSVNNESDPNSIALAWSKVLGSSPSAEPIILGQICLIPLEAEDVRGSVLRALTLSQGNSLWELCFEDVYISGFTQAREDLVLVSLSQIDPYDGEGALLAVDARGREIWRFTPGAEQISIAAVGEIAKSDIKSYETEEDSLFLNAEGLVVITADHQWLEIIDLETGNLLLEVNLPSQATLTAPAFGQDSIFVPCLAPTVLAIGMDGGINWRFDAAALSGVRVDFPPCVVGNLVIVSMSNGVVYALHSRDGTLVWETQINPRDKILTAPVTDGTRVYIGSGDGIHALQITNGQEVWFSPTGRPILTCPLVWNDLVIVITGDRFVYAVDRHTGRTRWQESLENDSYFAPVVVDGDALGPYAIVVDNLGNAFALTIPAHPVMHETAGRWQRAAQAWEYQGRSRRAAMAWVRHAQSLLQQGNALSTCATAWQSAERLFTLLGDEERAANCRREYSRSLGLPLISLEVEHKGLMVNTWSLLNFSVSNEGYGLARHLVIQTQAKQFEGQVSMTQALAHLPTGRSRNRRLDVKPLEAGTSVPLRVEVSYVDEQDTFHSKEETIYLSVGQSDLKGTPTSLSVITQPSGRAILQPIQRNSVDIEIRFSAGIDNYAVEISLDDGHVFSGGTLSKSVLTWRPSGNPIDDGRHLFNQLVNDPIIRDAWRIAQGEAITQSLPRRIRLRIGDDVPELHIIPWELLHDGNVLISANSSTPFSRYLPVPKPWGQPLISSPIKVLGVISNPRDLRERYQLNRLDVDLEKYILATAFKGLGQGKVRLEFLPSPVTPQSLSHVLRSGYQIVHFVGHGRFVRHSKRAELLMESQDGSGQPVTDQTLAQIFSHADVRPHLVFLSACQSASHSSRDAFVGMGPKLIQAGVPAVIGMQDRVSIATARKITQIFYRRLTDHGYVDTALNEARASLMAADPSALHTPVLFMRLPSGRLWDLTQ